MKITLEHVLQSAQNDLLLISTELPVVSQVPEITEIITEISVH